MAVDAAIKKLQEIISNNKKHNCLNQTVTIREKISTPLNHVVLSGLGDDVVAIQFDKIGFGDKTFTDGHKARKACDAIIFCQLEGEGYILILDLKSSIHLDTNHIPQLVSGDCFADYLVAVLERFEQIKVTNWKRRYFIFHCASNKRTTLPAYAQEPPNNIRADKAHILQVANGEPIPLRKLLQQPL
ncbi:MAG: hypothetical protein QX191_09590 [Methylococcaceae bacterium]